MQVSNTKWPVMEEKKALLIPFEHRGKEITGTANLVECEDLPVRKSKIPDSLFKLIMKQIK